MYGIKRFRGKGFQTITKGKDLARRQLRGGFGALIWMSYADLKEKSTSCFNIDDLSSSGLMANKC